ncbi:MAG: plastocyanin/azurin family copper-binding protein [Candidatus Eremiobacteraeota bacterium]|nr:plastocyanin/azurin family copper-binding protein [Candidatus Eremiobacteraeota bacterium]
MGQNRRAASWLAAVVALAGCTPGAALAPSDHNAAGNALVIAMSLVKYGQSASPFGTVQAYNPSIVTVATGATIQFRNDDAFSHTATMISGAFPASNMFQSSALSPNGHDLTTAAWSTGDVAGNGFSQTLVASTPGTYLYGCYHHYPTMRGVIIVQ